MIDQQELIKSEVHIKYEQAATRHNYPVEVTNEGGRIWTLKGCPKFQLLTRVSSVIVDLADMPEALMKLGYEGMSLDKHDASYTIDIEVISGPPDVNDPNNNTISYQVTLYLNKRLNDSDEAVEEARMLLEIPALVLRDIT